MSTQAVPFVQKLKSSLEHSGCAEMRIVVGVSGGADSVSLLRGLVCVMNRDDLCVAHLDHQLRGAESTADAEWVTDLCCGLKVQCIVEKRDVAQLAEAWGVGIEEAARRARYEYFEHACDQFQASILALAHTADDQAETVLHHILRGTGLSGLKGMPAARPLNAAVNLVRPLLGVRRPEVLEFLADLQQPYREDRSNFDPSFTRNRIRQQLLPLLAEQFNPHVVDGFLRLSQQAAEVQEWVEHSASLLLTRALLSATADELRFDVTLLRDEPRHLVREMLVLAWKQQGWPRQKMGFDDWNRLVDVALDGTAVTLPGPIEARRKRQTLEVRDLRDPGRTCSSDKEATDLHG